MNTRHFLDEHKTELSRMVKHLGPYLVAFWGVIGALVAQGWLDTPARSQTVAAVEEKANAANKKADLNSAQIVVINKTLHEIEVNSGKTSESLKSMEREQQRQTQALEKIVDHLLNKN